MRAGSASTLRSSRRSITLPILATLLLSALNVVALRYNESLKAYNFNYNQGEHVTPSSTRAPLPPPLLSSCPRVIEKSRRVTSRVYRVDSTRLVSLEASN